MRRISGLTRLAAAAALVLPAASCGAAAAKGGYQAYEPGYYSESSGMEPQDAYGGSYGAATGAAYGMPAPAPEEMAYSFGDDMIGGDLLRADTPMDYAKAMPVAMDGPVYADLGLKDKGQPATGPAAGPAPGPGPGPQTPEPPVATDAGGKKDRIMLYDAQIGLAVFRVEEQLEEIEKLVDGWGGYLLSMDTSQISFRVPADKFDEAVAAVSKLGDVTYKNVTGTDVTEEYMDLQIRLANALVMRDRFIELLAQAKTVDDSLKVEHEIERITEEIELIKGRLKYLTEASQYSKITVYLSVKKKAKKPLPPLYAPFQWIQDVGLDTLFGF